MQNWHHAVFLLVIIIIGEIEKQQIYFKLFRCEYDVKEVECFVLTWTS